jgi:hypothetical protein
VLLQAPLDAKDTDTTEAKSFGEVCSKCMPAASTLTSDILHAGCDKVRDPIF